MEEKIPFYKFFIWEAYDFLRKWELWAVEETEGVDQEFHLNLIRLCKGLLKVWRKWLIQRKSS